jgi:hypothetical protein
VIHKTELECCTRSENFLKRFAVLVNPTDQREAISSFKGAESGSYREKRFSHDDQRKKNMSHN